MLWLDWLVVGSYVLLVLFLGAWTARRAGRSPDEYFLGGRRLHWALLGLSMVATTFAADTPLAVTELVRTKGIWGNWMWWVWGGSHVLALFLFSRLWSRAGVMTDAEFVELRYPGPMAGVLRGIKGLVMALGFNVLVLAWVTQAMGTIFSTTLGWDPDLALGLSGLVAVAYTVASGLWGVVLSDVLQFGVALVGAVALAVFAVQAAGGLDAVVRAGATGARLDFLPPGDFAWERFWILVGVGWLATHNADAGGYFMQRLSAARDERHAFGAALVFLLGHYVVRVWPWILVALASLVLLPEVADHKAVYPLLAMQVLPAGLRGLLLASLLAAFMSTVDTHLNWGASYLVRDLYGRFLRPAAGHRELVLAARLSSVLLAGLAVLASRFVHSISGAWALLYSLGAGLGPLLVLRWFWWRVTALAELVVLLASAILGALLTARGVAYEYRLGILAGLGLGLGVLVSWIWPPRDTARLSEFWQRIRPGGWWGPVAGDAGAMVLTWWLLPDALAGLLIVFGSCLGIGALLLERCALGLLLLAGAAVGGGYLLWRLRGGLGRDLRLLVGPSPAPAPGRRGPSPGDRA